MKKNSLYSIIIPNYKGGELLSKCLEAIFSNTTSEIEIIVVDDASRDGATKFLEAQKNVRVYINNENMGFAKSCNKGATIAKGDILVFLNNDTEVQRGWLEAIRFIIETEENVGAVGVKLLFPNKKIQHAGVVISPDKIPRHIYYQVNNNRPELNMERDFQSVTAACIAIPRVVFEEFGGFDEDFRNGMEDVDLCLKIKKGGYRIVYTPDSVVIHHESVAPGRHKNNKYNMDLYMSRWRSAESDEHKYYKEDGKSALWILGQDLRSMSSGPDEYGTRPLYVSILRYFYIPMHKIYVLLAYLFKGDFAGLAKKIRGKYNV